MNGTEDIRIFEARVADSTRAAQAGERLRLWVNAVPVLGAPLAVLMAWLHPLLGSVAVASLTLAWLVGIYRTERLCQNTAGRLQDAELDLSHARAQGMDAVFAQVGPEADADAAWSRAGTRRRRDRSAHPPVHPSRHH